MKLHFATEFSRFPFGRDAEDGKYNGTAFRDLLADKFREAQQKREVLEVVLDDVAYVDGSFARASFGKLSHQFHKEHGRALSEKEITISGNRPHYEFFIYKIWECINEPPPKEGGR